MDLEKLKTLKKQLQSYQNIIFNLNENIKNNINEINNIIQSNCNHEYVYDITCQFDDKNNIICIKCNNYK